MIAGPVYISLSSSGFDEAREEALKEIDRQSDQDFLNTSRQISNKGVDVGESVANDFVSGIRNSAVNLALISLVAILIAVFWNAITDVIIRYWPAKDEEPDPPAEIA
jgi:hypothetical protein